MTQKEFDSLKVGSIVSVKCRSGWQSGQYLKTELIQFIDKENIRFENLEWYPGAKFNTQREHLLSDDYKLLKQ